MANAAGVLALGTSAVNAGQAEIDVSGLEGSDSSALAVLLAWYRTARAQERSVTFAGVPKELRSLGHLYGIDVLLPGFSG